MFACRVISHNKRQCNNTDDSWSVICRTLQTFFTPKSGWQVGQDGELAKGFQYSGSYCGTSACDPITHSHRSEWMYVPQPSPLKIRGWTWAQTREGYAGYGWSKKSKYEYTWIYWLEHISICLGPFFFIWWIHVNSNGKLGHVQPN